MFEVKYELTQDNISLKEAEELQEKYRMYVEKNCEEPSKLLTLSSIKKVVGVDISYFNINNEECGVSSAVLWDILNNKMEYHSFAKDIVKFPYKPGFLGFRECKLLTQAIYKLKMKPDLVICDGHGVIHPKKFGEAVQLGLAINIPSIGVAKNPFVGYSKWGTTKRKKGNKTPIWKYNPKLKNKSKQELLGYKICLKDNTKPVFLSVGYKTTLDLAIQVALKTTLNHRQPEPLYLADQLSKVKVKEILSSYLDII